MKVQGFVGGPAAALRSSVVQVVAGRNWRGGSGAGIVWRDRLVVTNAHVASTTHVTVVTSDGRALEGVVAARDEHRDLAIIETGNAQLPHVTTADASRLRPGAVVFAIGHPFGVKDAVSAGVFQAVGPLPPGLDFAALKGRGALDWVQASVRLSPGNSGGPLADAEGRVIGVAAMVVAGLALAVPVSAVSAMVARLP